MMIKVKYVHDMSLNSTDEVELLTAIRPGTANLNILTII